jgi:hypothetical protein
VISGVSIRTGDNNHPASNDGFTLAQATTGTSGDDVLNGGEGWSGTISSGAGNDTIMGASPGGGTVVDIYGGPGNDTVHMHGGEDDYSETDIGSGTIYTGYYGDETYVHNDVENILFGQPSL